MTAEQKFDQEFQRLLGQIMTRHCKEGKTVISSSSPPPSDSSQKDWNFSMKQLLNMVKLQYAFEKKDLPSRDLKNDKDLAKIVEEQLKKLQMMSKNSQSTGYSDSGCREVFYPLSVTLAM
jgi:hypothetical protein